MSIMSLLNQVRNDEIVLPAIQRDFVWDEDQIGVLLDSIMRGYPIGIVLLWETYGDTQYRSFVRDYRSSNLCTFHDNSQRRRLKLVLDGQQRLQSLYVALYGTLEGKSLYFDVLSGTDSDDMDEEKYFFWFATTSEVNELGTWVLAQLARPEGKRAKDFVLEHYERVSDLLTISIRDRRLLAKQLSERLSLSDEEEARVETNLSNLEERLSRDDGVLRVTTIDENLPSHSHCRKSEADVLEIFVRVNSGGTLLTRSDLVFSMLKLNWKESTQALPEFVKGINEGNSLDLDTDFVIRCLFAVSDLGTKFNVDLLRKKSNVAKLRTNFESCCHAIRAAVDFLQTDCWCQSSRVIGGSSTLVPLVYYLFHTKDHQVRNDQVAGVRKALYVFGFARPFSRYADSRLQTFIREELRPLADQGDETFPLDAAISWVRYWERIAHFDEELLQSNHPLALHVVQGLSGARVHYAPNAPEVDHIFPRSVLRQKGFDEAIINHFANFWILSKGKNQNKSNRHPRDYFADVDDTVLRDALIERDLLDYAHYTTFVKKRSERMLEKIGLKLQLSEEDFKVDD